MSPNPQELDLGLSLFIAGGAGLVTFLGSVVLLFSLLLSLGWLKIQICLIGPCAPPEPHERWPPYVILMAAGVLAALVFAKMGTWALRITMSDRRN
jgi:hypothetical protein